MKLENGKVISFQVYYHLITVYQMTLLTIGMCVCLGKEQRQVNNNVYRKPQLIRKERSFINDWMILFVFEFWNFFLKLTENSVFKSYQRGKLVISKTKVKWVSQMFYTIYLKHNSMKKRNFIYFSDNSMFYKIHTNFETWSSVKLESVGSKNVISAIQHNVS